MNNPYAQVALTYLRRPFSSWFGFLFVFVILGMAPSFFVMGRNGNHQKFTFSQLMLFVFLFGLLVVHIKEQFIDSRAHLTPDFRRIHATVAGIAALICAVLLPASFAWLIGWHSIGFVAITVLLFGTILWMLLSMSSWLIWPMGGGWMLLATESGRVFAQQLVSGKFEYQAVGILAIGFFIVLLGGIRLVRLNEEMPEYQWFKWNWASGKVETTGPKVAQESIYVRWRYRRGEKQMTRLISHAMQASASRWSQVCRWQAGMMTGWSVINSLLPFLLYLFFLTWLMSFGKLSISFPAMLCSILPAGVVLGVSWRRRKSVLPRESLMCVDRTAYLKQVGMAAALSQFQVWLGMATILLCWWQWFAPQIPPVTVAYVLALSALAQTWFFGLGVWLLRFRSPVPIFLGSMVSMQVFLFAMMGMTQGPWSSSQAVVLLVATVFAVLGLVVTWDAYRRWLVTDFD